MTFESSQHERGSVNFDLFRSISERLNDEDLSLKIAVLEKQVNGNEGDLPDLLSENFVEDVIAQSDRNPTVIRKQLDILYEIQDSRKKSVKVA